MRKIFITAQLIPEEEEGYTVYCPELDIYTQGEKEGFEVARQRGSHVQVRKYVEGRKITFPIPVHPGKILKSGTSKGILRKANISVEELSKLL